MHKLIQQILNSFEREHTLFAFLKILRYGIYLVRSLPIRWAFKAPGLYIGPKFLLLGSKYIKFGKNFYAHSNLWIEAIPEYKGQNFSPSIVIGDNVSMGDSVHVSCNNSVTIGSNVLFGSNVFVGDHQHGIYTGFPQSLPQCAPAIRALGTGYGIEIGSNVWIGNNVVIVGSVIIGEGAIIAANSVVTKNVSSATMVGGIPARNLKYFDINSHTWKLTT
jgi:acetyltransferase-like isoleucine patch superfamily enzyme